MGLDGFWLVGTTVAANSTKRTLYAILNLTDYSL